jgi:hypothetical protein
MYSYSGPWQWVKGYCYDESRVMKLDNNSLSPQQNSNVQSGNGLHHLVEMTSTPDSSMRT